MATSSAAPLESPAVSHDDVVAETAGLSKRFGAMWAVRNVNLRVRRGELFGLLGPNGAGKSTTLFMLAGLVRPSAGTVRLFGRPPSEYAARARLGAMIETPSFIPYLTARKNLELLGRLSGLTDSHAIDGALERVGLAQSARRKVHTFSQGMRQRLGLAQAIQHQPDLLILDEPSNGLDPEGGLDMWRLLGELAAERGVTVLISSHLLHEIEEHCQRVCVLNQGQVVAQGTVEELLADPHPAMQADYRDEDEANRARQWLEGQDWIESVERQGARLRIRLARERAPELNAALHRAGQAPLYLAPARRTLRDFFLRLTS